MKNFNNNIKIKISDKNVNYLNALKTMQKQVDNIIYHNGNELIWFLNHNHIYTCGTSANKNEILKTTNIPIVQTNRGGKTTYHGPGQRIVYLLINLKNRKKDIRKFVSIIENSTIQVLKEFDIEAKTFSDRIGIWVTKNKKIKLEKEKKIGAIGLRVKNWITYHGLSFNINPDLDYYKKIDACGITQYSSTSIESLGESITNKEFDTLYLKFFLQRLKDL